MFIIIIFKRIMDAVLIIINKERDMSLSSDLLRAASQFLPPNEQGQFQRVEQGARLPNAAVNTIYINMAKSAPPLTGRDVVIAQNGTESVIPGHNLSSQKPIVLTVTYDANNPSQGRLDQIRGKKCYIKQLVLNSPPIENAPLGSYVKELIEASTYIGKISIDKALFPLNDELLTLIKENKDTIDNLAFDLRPGTQIPQRLTEAGFTKLSTLNLGPFALCTLTKKEITF